MNRKLMATEIYSWRGKSVEEMWPLHDHSVGGRRETQRVAHEAGERAGGGGRGRDVTASGKSVIEGVTV